MEALLEAVADLYARRPDAWIARLLTDLQDLALSREEGKKS